MAMSEDGRPKNYATPRFTFRPALDAAKEARDRAYAEHLWCAKRIDEVTLKCEKAGRNYNYMVRQVARAYADLENAQDQVNLAIYDHYQRLGDYEKAEEDYKKMVERAEKEKAAKEEADRRRGKMWSPIAGRERIVYYPVEEKKNKK